MLKQYLINVVVFTEKQRTNISFSCRQSVFLHREQLNKVKLKKEIESRELYHKLTLKYRMNRSLY